MNINQQAITKAQNGERLSFDEALYLYKHADILDLATWPTAWVAFTNTTLP